MTTPKSKSGYRVEGVRYGKWDAACLAAQRIARRRAATEPPVLIISMIHEEPYAIARVDHSGDVRFIAPEKQ